MDKLVGVRWYIGKYHKNVDKSMAYKVNRISCISVNKNDFNKISKVKSGNRSDIDSITSSKNIVDEFQKAIQHNISIFRLKYEKVFIVLPPTKKGRENQVKSLLSTLILDGVSGVIEFNSELYELKKHSNFEGRINTLRTAYDSWEISSEVSVTQNSAFIFIDDIFTSGLTALFVLIKISELFSKKILIIEGWDDNSKTIKNVSIHTLARNGGMHQEEIILPIEDTFVKDDTFTELF